MERKPSEGRLRQCHSANFEETASLHADAFPGPDMNASSHGPDEPDKAICPAISDVQPSKAGFVYNI
jgi:hypothetical protein